MSDSDSGLLTSYDQLPYESHPYDRTHPDHLATMARLFGMQPQDPNHCRVLEIGCAAGGNLIPMAVAMPESQFVGFDLSRTELEEGWKLIEALQLTNIRLEHVNILDYQSTAAEFDYVICHGVFSWVSAAARERIFAICRECLSENGVAYISYNTYPGWFMRGMVRQMMCFHARQFDDPRTQVEQARALLDFLNEAASGQEQTYQLLLRRELEIIRNRQDSYLFHEHLEQENEPLFFYQFMEQAAKHDLRFLCETQFSEMVPSQVSSAVGQTLQKLSRDIIHAEQYLDFVRNRTFRRTLLCRKECQLERELGAEQLQGLCIRASLKPEATSIPLEQSGPMRFISPRGVAVTLSHPSLKQSLLALCQHAPDFVPFERLPKLWQTGSESFMVRNAESLKQDYDELASMLFQLYAQDLVQIRCNLPRYATQIPAEPRTTSLIREQATHGDYVTNLKHEMVQLNDLDHHLLHCLEQTTAERRAYFQAKIESGELIIQTRDDSNSPAQVSDASLEELIKHGLKRLTDLALLWRE